MGDIKSLFQRDCEYRYIPGMDAEIKYTNKIRNVNMDFMDRIMVTGDITKTDFFYLRAVAFFRIADEKMVTEFIRYFRNYYGTNECSNLLQPSIVSKDANSLTYEAEFRRESAETLRRLHRLAKKYLMFAQTVINVNSGDEYAKTIFCANATTISMVRSFFGEAPFFGSENTAYEHFYCITPLQRMMETMHACRVGVLGFMKYKKRVTLIREKEIIFGSQKERYTPTMMAEIKCGEYDYKVIIEPIHFGIDERILTKSEHYKNVQSLIDTMGRLINHYNYMERKFQENPIKERIRFLIAAENLDGMKNIVKMMNQNCGKYSDKVFFTTDSVILATESLEDSVLMAKEVKSSISGEMHLGLIKAGRDTLIATQNEWIIRPEE